MRDVPVGRCHQSFMRDRFALEEAGGLFGSWWTALDMAPESAEVMEARREQVAPVIERYEWLGNIPDNCSLYAVLTFQGNVASALAFSRSGFGGSFTLFGHEAVKLSRGVTLHWAPPWAASRLINGAVRLLFDRVTYVVAFSDWEAGEVGTVYQASGWAYLGHKRSTEWVSPSGERRDASFHKVRVVSGSRHRKTGATATVTEYDRERDEMLSAGWRLRSVMRGKYATVAGPKGRDFRRLWSVLAPHSKSYPKRAGSVSGVHAPLPAERAGFDAPAALQSSANPPPPAEGDRPR